MSYKEIGHKLQKAREEAGLSQGELARQLGCTQSSLSNYELGKRRLYLADLQRISEILGKPVTFFLERTGDVHFDNKDASNFFEEPYLRDILLEVRSLKPSNRKSVLDFIRWQKSKEGGK